MIYATSDTHFGHKNVIVYSNRPYSSVEEMDEVLIDNWNSVVKPGDLVYHLGDFSFYKSREQTKKVLYRLNGQKNLIFGNHDKEIRRHANEFLNGKLFATMQDYKELEYYKTKIVMFHFPILSWNKLHHRSIHIHGHSHNSIPSQGRRVDIGVDSTAFANQYVPHSFDEIMDFMKDRKPEFVDHHKEKR
jgi:calcineurin-like phosphoesterase family protein